MGRAGLIATVLVLTGMIGGAAGAQNLRDPSPPAEQPPGSFSGTQFVDSRGCVYVRAGLGGATNWVPRVNRERKQLCGFEPTLTAMAAPTPAPQPAPAPTAPGRPPIRPGPGPRPSRPPIRHRASCASPRPRPSGPNPGAASAAPRPAPGAAASSPT